MKKKDSLFVQGDSSDDDKPLIKQPPLKRAASPFGEDNTVSKKAKKKSKKSDGTSSRKKISPVKKEDDLDESTKVTAPEKPVVSHKTLRFNSAVTSLLVDAPTHIMYESHFTEAMDTCRTGKKNSEKLLEVIEAVCAKAAEMGFDDGHKNNAIANVRASYHKQQAPLVTADIANSSDLLTLMESVITQVESKPAGDLDDPISLRRLCQDLTVVLKQKRGQPVLGGSIGSLANGREGIAPMSGTNMQQCPDRVMSTIEDGGIVATGTLKYDIDRAMACMSACQNSKQFSHLDKQGKSDRMKERFTTPGDLFIAYVLRYLQTSAEEHREKVDHNVNYDVAVAHWDSLNPLKQAEWTDRHKNLLKGETWRLTSYRDDRDVTRSLHRLKEATARSQQSTASTHTQGHQKQHNNAGEYQRQDWQGSIPSRPSPNPITQTFGFGQGTSVGRPSGMNGSGGREHGQVSSGAVGSSALRHRPSTATSSYTSRTNGYGSGMNGYGPF